MVQRSQERGTVSPDKKGPRRLHRYLSLISIPELGICLVSKAHVTKMKLILNFFSLLGVQIPQNKFIQIINFTQMHVINFIQITDYFQEVCDLHKVNYVQC